MSEEEKKKENAWEISRREFLKDAGLVIGGATIGSMALGIACSGGGGTSTVTRTTTVGASTVTQTTTVGASTVTSPPVTVTVSSTATGSVDTRTVLNVNGTDYKVDVEPYWSLSFVLRERLGLIGTKWGCDRGQCGMCQVLIDDKLVLSCLYLAKNATGHKIVTAESLAHDNAPWDPIATAFAKNNALQCGFCTPSFMLSTKALLAKYPKPTIAQVQEGLSGVLCICSTYTKAMQTVMKLGGG